MQNSKSPKIYIVEDNADLREIYRLRFEAGGFEVVTSPDGLDFLTKIETEKPDIILLDLMLPEVDGFTVMENMKKNFQNSEVKDIPIIAWTNLGEDSDVRKALTSGATIYLRKSDYEGDDLVGKVRDIMMQQKAKTQ